MEEIQVETLDPVESVSDNYITLIENSFESQALDTFDRIVSDLPSYYAYCAYSMEDGSWILVSGSTYSISGGIIYFGEDARISRFYESNDSIALDTYISSNYSITLEASKVYYTNLLKGYPALGDHELNFTNIACLALIVTVLTVILNRSSRR